MSKDKTPTGGPSIKNSQNIGPINNLEKVKNEEKETLWAPSIEKENAKKRPAIDSKVKDAKKEMETKANAEKETDKSKENKNVNDIEKDKDKE